MSAGPFIHYASFAREFARGGFDWERVQLRAMLVSDSYKPDLERDVNAYDLVHLEARPAGVIGGVRCVRPSDGGNGTIAFKDVTDPFGFVVFFDAETGALVGYQEVGRQRLSGKIVLDLNEPEPNRIAPIDVRFKRAGGRDHDVRVGPDHGHVRRDDRGALRHPHRYCSRGDSDPTRRSGDMTEPADVSDSILEKVARIYRDETSKRADEGVSVVAVVAERIVGEFDSDEVAEIVAAWVEAHPRL